MPNPVYVTDMYSSCQHCAGDYFLVPRPQDGPPSLVGVSKVCLYKSHAADVATVPSTGNVETSRHCGNDLQRSQYSISSFLSTRLNRDLSSYRNGLSLRALRGRVRSSVHPLRPFRFDLEESFLTYPSGGVACRLCGSLALLRLLTLLRL